MCACVVKENERAPIVGALCVRVPVRARSCAQEADVGYLEVDFAVACAIFSKRDLWSLNVSVSS